MSLTRILILSLLVLYPTITQASLFRYQDKATELYGFKDAAGKVVIRPQFTAIYEPDDVLLFSPKNKETEYTPRQ